MAIFKGAGVAIVTPMYEDGKVNYDKLEELLEYPFIIETPGCDNDILHLLEKCTKKPQVSYSFRDDTLIMAFVKNGFGVTVSQDLVMRAFSDGVEVRPLEPESHRTIGLSFARTTNSVVSGVLLDYLQKSLQKYDSSPSGS